VSLTSYHDRRGGGGDPLNDGNFSRRGKGSSVSGRRKEDIARRDLNVKRYAGSAWSDGRGASIRSGNMRNGCKI